MTTVKHATGRKFRNHRSVSNRRGHTSSCVTAPATGRKFRNHAGHAFAIEEVTFTSVCHCVKIRAGLNGPNVFSFCSAAYFFGQVLQGGLFREPKRFRRSFRSCSSAQAALDCGMCNSPLEFVLLDGVPPSSPDSMLLCGVHLRPPSTPWNHRVISSSSHPQTRRFGKVGCTRTIKVPWSRPC